MSGQHLRYTLLSKPVLFFPLFFSLFSLLHARPGQFNPEIDEDSNGVVIPSQNSTSPTHHLSVQNNFNDRQAKQDLSPELWQEVHMDEYLRQYPGGFNLSLLVSGSVSVLVILLLRPPKDLRIELLDLISGLCGYGRLYQLSMRYWNSVQSFSGKVIWD